MDEVGTSGHPSVRVLKELSLSSFLYHSGISYRVMKKSQDELMYDFWTDVFGGPKHCLKLVWSDSCDFYL